MNRSILIDALSNKFLWAVILFCLIGFGVYKWADAKVPPQHLFWKPLNLNAPNGMATKTQLLKLSLAPRAQCLALIQSEAKDTVYTALEPSRTDKGCGWDVSLQASQMAGITFRPNTMDSLCPMQAASYIWLKNIDQSAQALLGSKLKRVHHYGTYSCRNIAGTSTLSEHAFSNAWDVAAFELADGRMISVKKDWDGKGPKAGFLHAARDEACAVFRVTLSPDYNAAHADHFHLDMGPTTSCR